MSTIRVRPLVCRSGAREAGPTVLVVDDSPCDRRLAGAMVEKAGVRVVYAADGREALAVLGREPVTAVVTDLQMPHLDGLQLVEEVLARFPLVPVILMTANGSEEIAMRALQAGAASYVPKAFLARDLAPTLERVLALAQSDRRRQRLLECFTALDCQLVLENDPALVPPFIAHFQDYLSRMKLCDDNGKLRVGVALEEALLNGMYHGNLELSSDLRQDGGDAYQRLADERRGQSPYAERRLHVRVSLKADEAVFAIRDEGPGFDAANLPDPTDPENVLKLSGRGLLLIRTFMDEVTHNAAGNQITLVRRRR